MLRHVSNVSNVNRVRVIARQRDDATVELLRFGASLLTLAMAVILMHAG